MSSNAFMTCMVCQDGADQVALLLSPCGNHATCIECLRAAVQTAVKDESTYPVDCGSTLCGPIPDKFIIDTLAGQGPTAQLLLDAFKAKVEEYQVIGKDRTYCANKDCMSMLGSSRYLNYATFGFQGKVICPECDGIICCSCKAVVTDEATHNCEPPNYYQVLEQYISSLPEDERWLWQKCYSCGRWTDKIEACNHMTCNCKAEFCLICGRPWEGLVSCTFGCPKNGAPVYDDDGYNQNGFHRETGLDREGNPWTNDWEDANGWADDDDIEQQVFDEDGFDQWGFGWDGLDREGYDHDGFNLDGDDREGYSRDGFNRAGFNRAGFDFWGWDAAGFDRDGFGRSGRDKNGFFEDGYDMDGFDANSIGLQGLPRSAYDENGYDADGWTVFGFSRAGFDAQGYDTDGYSITGFDRAGYDRRGFAANGFTFDGYDRFGKNVLKYRRSGFNSHHLNAQNEIEPGYSLMSDGNRRRTVDEGPEAGVMECDHKTHHGWSGATCVVCHWHSDLFHRHCDDCGAHLCRDCDRFGVERQRMSLRHQYLWPGSDSYGIEEMFAREEGDD